MALNTNLIQAYVSTVNKWENETSRKDEITISMGDFSAKLGKGRH